MSIKMSVLKINKSITIRKLSNQIKQLRRLGICMDEIHSDIDYIGLSCCKTYMYGNFYNHYYKRLYQYFSSKIKKIKLIRQNESANIYYDNINEEDPRQAGLTLSDDYVSSFVSDYVQGNISDNDFSSHCTEFGLEKTLLLSIISQYYSSKIT